MWILGIDQGYRPEFRKKLPDVTWERPFWHQHDISILSTGELMIFDNGASGAFSPDPLLPLEEMESFALCFDVDEEAGTARETWRYGGRGVLPFALYVSGVCETGNGNRFIACSGIVRNPDGKLVQRPPLGIGRIELIEVTPEKEVVFHGVIKAEGVELEKGWNGFRPEFLAPDLASKLA